MPMKVYVVRHGESESNAAGCYSGWSQARLTERGRQDALRAGQLLKDIVIDRVYASDLPRAMETARLALPGRKLELRPELRENHVGAFQDQPVAWCDAQYGQISIQARQKRDFTPVGGENIAMVMERVSRFMKELEALPSQSTTAVFCHEWVIKRMLAWVLDVPVETDRLWLGNGSVSAFSYQDKWQLDSWNLCVKNDPSLLE